MIKKINALNGDDLYQIAFAIKNAIKNFDYNNINIIIKTPPEMINKINEDFYYRNNPNSSQVELDDVDEIDVNVNDIKFKYIVDNDSE